MINFFAAIEAFNDMPNVATVASSRGKRITIVRTDGTMFSFDYENPVHVVTASGGATVPFDIDALADLMGLR